jgi:hypothetical protein
MTVKFGRDGDVVASAGQVFDKKYGPEAYQNWKNTHSSSKARPGYDPEDYTDRDLRAEFATAGARSAALGGWVAGANEHAEALHKKHGMDWNDMRKYANMANVNVIDSENDIANILAAKADEYRPKEELEKPTPESNKPRPDPEVPKEVEDWHTGIADRHNNWVGDNYSGDAADRMFTDDDEIAFYEPTETEDGKAQGLLGNYIQAILAQDMGDYG